MIEHVSNVHMQVEFVDYLLEILDRGKASLDEMKAKGQL